MIQGMQAKKQVTILESGQHGYFGCMDGYGWLNFLMRARILLKCTICMSRVVHTIQQPFYIQGIVGPRPDLRLPMS